MSNDRLEDHMYTIAVGEREGIELIGALADACNVTDDAYSDLMNSITSQMEKDYEQSEQ